MSNPEYSLRYARLRPEHSSLISVFQNQEPDLVAFLKDDALRDQAWRLSETFLLFMKNVDETAVEELIGFVTLLADAIRLHDNPELAHFFQEKGIAYSTLPGLRIGRMAVDSRYQKRHFGNELATFSVNHGRGLPIGCRILTVDAKPDAVGFYEKLGFKRFLVKERKTMKLYLDLLAPEEKPETKESTDKAD